MTEELRDTSLPFSVAASFDAISARFDADLENDLTRRIRQALYATIQELVHPNSLVLDINCGTGIDVIELANRGHAVTGLDLSLKMIEQAREKSSRAGIHGLRFYHGSFDRMPRFGDHLFDLVLSNFGGLNCTDNLAGVAAEIARVSGPSAYFIGVVMPPFSLWEFLSCVVRGNLSGSVRRLRTETVATGFGGRTFSVYYHPPADLIRAFAPWFDFRRLAGISIFAPTPQSTRFVRTHPKLTRGLEKLDSLVGFLPIFRSIGDHYIIIMQRKPT